MWTLVDLWRQDNMANISISVAKLGSGLINPVDPATIRP
jgi:hypothetical protein